MIILKRMKMKMKSFSCVQLFATPWTVTHQTLQSMEFSRQGYWSGLLFPSPGDLPDPGIEPGSPVLQADALLSEPPGKIFVCISYIKKIVTHLITFFLEILTKSWNFVFCLLQRDDQTMAIKQ